MYFIGIDIGSTASKVVVKGNKDIFFTIPTGWNSRETAKGIRGMLEGKGIDLEDNNTHTVATGYGRISVDFAEKIITEITCHGKGGFYLAGDDCTIIDVGGQDTKIINVEKGIVTDFLMNDKCSAGTGKFIEIMANRLNVTIEELFDLARVGKVIKISSTCTVFAESEIINYMGEGKAKEDVAAGIIDSVTAKVVTMAQRFKLLDKVIITGGLSNCEYFSEVMSEKLNKIIKKEEQGRYAGAIGAALVAENSISG